MAILPKPLSDVRVEGSLFLVLGALTLVTLDILYGFRICQIVLENQKTVEELYKESRINHFSTWFYSRIVVQDISQKTGFEEIIFQIQSFPSIKVRLPQK